MRPVGFEPTISAGERPPTHALDHAATGPACLALRTLFQLCINTGRSAKNVSIRTINTTSDKTFAYTVVNFRVRKIWHALCFLHYMFLGGQKNSADFEKSNKEAKVRIGL